MSKVTLTKLNDDVLIREYTSGPATGIILDLSLAMFRLGLERPNTWEVFRYFYHKRICIGSYTDLLE